MKKVTCLTNLLLTLVVAAVTVCLTDAAAAGVSVVDFRNRTLTLDKPAERIVCLIESALSGLYMLGAENRVIAIPATVYSTDVNRWYAALDERINSRQLPAPGNWDFVSLEAVIALRPDLVIIWAEQSDTIEALESRGIPVFGVFLTSKEDVYREITALGTLTGSERRADELLAYTGSELRSFSSRLPAGLSPARTYYMWAQGMLETSCGGSTVNDLIGLAGGRNVCADTPSEHMIVNLENLLRWDPELIVMWYNERLSPRDILGDPQWQSVSAVRHGRVHEFPEVFLCDLWTLKFQFAVKMVAKWAHPELFADIDLEAEQMKMLKFLYGRTLTKN